MEETRSCRQFSSSAEQGTSPAEMSFSVGTVSPLGSTLECLCRCFFQAYIQFSSSLDTDRFGVWHSLKQFSGEAVYRQRAPSVCPPQTNIKTAAGECLSDCGSVVRNLTSLTKMASSSFFCQTKRMLLMESLSRQ